jgi:prepilin-type N-terminal cleavage/methylation domain-containing protein
MKHSRTAENQSRIQLGKHAFTLIELLVIVAVLAILTTMALASAVVSRTHVWQAQCAGNLRQIGAGLSIYSTDANGFLPVCNYSESFTWYSYLAGRVVPESGNLTEGYVNLGLLFRKKAVPDAKAFYCPAQSVSNFWYAYYATSSNGWPSTPIGSFGDDKIRAGYTYFPQLRKTEMVSGYTLPKVTTQTISLEYGTCTALAPAKLAEINPQKSITTDLVSYNGVTHRANGAIVGANALFPDGKVVFQSAWTNQLPFAPNFWSGIENNSLNFRIIMNSWKP